MKQCWISALQILTKRLLKAEFTIKRALLRLLPWNCTYWRKLKKIKIEEIDPSSLKKPKIAPIVREPLVKPKLLRHAPVPYPAKAGGQAGRVIVCILVGADGVPEYVSTAASSGNPFLDGAALEECIKWRFSPAQDMEGNDVRCIIYIPVDIKP